MQTVVTGKPEDPLDDLRPLPAPAWAQRGSFSDIRYEVAEGIAKITICRPERRNAFRPQTLFELTEAFTLARDDPDVGVIILCGEGPDAFCSGGDQKIRGEDGYVGGDDEVAQRGIGRLNVLDLQIQMRRTPKPIVAMVAGYAVGGGHILHLVCDLTIAADNARFGQTGPKVGSFDGGYGSSILARTIGLKREGGLVPLPPVRRGAGARVGPRQRRRAARGLGARDGGLVPADAPALADRPAHDQGGNECGGRRPGRCAAARRRRHHALLHDGGGPGGPERVRGAPAA